MKEVEIAGKWALVTGAASGMGRTTALELAREGAVLVLVDVNGEGLGKVAREAEALGAEVHTFAVDLTDWSQVKNMADTIHSRWGPIDILVNSAGIACMYPLVEMSLSDWEFILAINLWSMIYMVKAFAPEMIKRRSGHIVNVSSAQAFFAVPTWGAYATTKYAVEGYSEALRYELFLKGVQVTAVFPGIVRTPFYDTITGTVLVKVGMKILMATAASPERLAQLIVRGIKRRRRIVISGIAWPLYLFKSLLSPVFENAGRAIAWSLRKEKGICLTEEDSP